MTVDSAIAAAEASFRAGDYALALDTLRPRAAEADASPAVLRLTALCLLRRQAPQEALALLERALALVPDDPWTRLHVGIALQANGRHAEAARCFRICQTLLPADPAPFLNFAVCQLALGDAITARRAVRRARLRAPRMPQVHYTLGLVQAELGQDGAAEAAFRRATQLAPSFVQAWVSLGATRLRLGATAGAINAARRALAIAPYHREATTHLATVLRLTGDGPAAEALLRALLQRDGDAAAVRIDLAAAILHEDRADEAAEILRAEPPATPALREQWLLQTALLHLQRGHGEAAQNAIAQVGMARQQSAPLLWRKALLAELGGEVAQARRHAVAAADALNRTNLAKPELQVVLHDELGRFWSRHGDVDRAFGHWKAGHALLARYQPFSRAETQALSRATMAQFDGVRLAQGAKAAVADDTPVFIVGLPRTGITLVEQVLTAHHAVHGAGARSGLDRLALELGGGGIETEAAIRRIAALDGDALTAAARRYLAGLHALAPAAKRILDRTPGNARHLGLVALMLPKARVIWCDRDPRDVGLSIYSSRTAGRRPYAHDLADLGWYIAQHRRLMLHWLDTMPNPIHVVRLRDWVDDFGGTLRGLTRFLGLPYDPACERFHTLDRPAAIAGHHPVREPIHARGINRWRQYERHLAPLTDALTQTVARYHATDEGDPAFPEPIPVAAKAEWAGSLPPSRLGGTRPVGPP